MATCSEITKSIQDIASHCGVGEDLLDGELASDKFHEISKCITAWKLLAPLLKITPAEVEVIEEDNRKTEMQRIGLLEKWKQKNAHRATYRALMEALLGIDRVDDAKKVCQVLKGTAEDSSLDLIRKIQAQTVCTLCQKTYTTDNPKTLLCQHVYCQQCLEERVKDQTLTCPKCGQPTPVPASGVAGLPTSLQVHADPPEGAEVPVPLRAASPPPAKREFFCGEREHSREKVALYCVTCDKLICNECALKWGRHHAHDYERLNEAAEKHRLEMTASLVPLKQRLTGNKEALARLEGCCGELTDQQKGIEGELDKVFEELHEILHVRKKELANKFCQSTRKQLEKLAEPRHQLETTQARLSSCLDNIKESLETESHEEMLANKTTVAKEVDNLLSMSLPELEPIQEHMNNGTGILRVL